jgi:sugar phosphate isomerase/epimerase
MHMNYNDEDPESIRDYIHMIQHVHVCEKDRLIPEEAYSEHLQHCLNVLKDLGYDKTISFEAKGGSEPDGMQKALDQLKAHFAE